MLIADGHHRYQTACTYAGDAGRTTVNLPGPYDLALAFVVELSEEELSIRAIHRLVKGIAAEQLWTLPLAGTASSRPPEDLVALPATSAPA